ncbi:hypothetical protein QM565_29910 [Geitlerinema splendidum]|nr:hypothetical protein [Geitlerinema splendidum]
MTWKYVKEEVSIMHRGINAGIVDRAWLQTHAQLLTYYIEQLSDDKQSGEEAENGNQQTYPSIPSRRPFEFPS